MARNGTATKTQPGQSARFAKNALSHRLRSRKRIFPSRYTNQLGDWITSEYFAAFTVGDSHATRILNLLNVMYTAKTMQMDKVPKERIAPGAAWRVLRMCGNEEKMTNGFFEKLRLSTSLILRSPNIAYAAADRFILLRTLPTNANGSHAQESKEYQQLLSRIFLYATFLRLGEEKP